MDFIGLDKVLFTSALFSMDLSARNITAYAENWSSMGENSKVFDLYLEKYEQLQTIIQKYRQLALRDISEIRKVGTEIIDIDCKLTDVWKE